MSKLALEVETPKEAGERIASAHDPVQFLSPWTARRSLAKLIQKELQERDTRILQSVKNYYSVGGTDNA